MNLWGKIFAAAYDVVMAGSERAGLSAQRAVLLADAHGDVLELGAGTGLNLRHYGPAVKRLVLAEPEEPMARRLELRVQASGRQAEVVRAEAEALPFPDASFDVIVSTLVLCTVADRQRTLAEVARLLRPGGRLLFLEHVRSDDPRLAVWQDRVAPLWLHIGHGCRCNSDTLSLIEASALRVVDAVDGKLPRAAPILRPTVTGVALR